MSILFLLASVPVVQASPVVKWEAPTIRENSELLKLEEISKYELAIEIDDVPIDLVSSTSNSYTIPFDLTDVSYFTVKVRTVDTSGLTSDWSNTVTYTVPSEPMTPSNVTIECNGCTLINIITK